MELTAWFHEDPEWRGWVLRDARQDLLAKDAFVTWLAGLRYYDASRGSGFDPGASLIVRPDPTNPVDTDAIGVYDASGTLGGNLPRSLVRDVQARESWSGLSMLEHRRNGQRVGLWLAVSHEPLTLRQPDGDAEPKWSTHELRRIQDASRRSETQAQEQKAWHEVDPMEQMLRMARDDEGPASTDAAD